MLAAPFQVMRSLAPPIPALAVAMILAGVFAGCGSNDASVSGRDTSPAAKVNFPDHFGTVAHKCDGPNMIYETENGGSTGKGAFAVAPNDPRCKGATP